MDSTLSLFRCPACRADQPLAISPESLDCAACNRSYPRVGGAVIVGVNRTNDSDKMEELVAELKCANEVYDDGTHLEFLRSWAPKTEQLADELVGRNCNGVTVLDLGAGCGELSWQFTRRGARVCAVELVPSHVFCAGILSEDRYFDRVVSDIDLMPFTDSSFDLVLCKEILHHCENLKTLAFQISRVLKPTGLMVALEPCLGLRGDAAARRGDAALREMGLHHYYRRLNDYASEMHPYLRFRRHRVFNPEGRRRGLRIPKPLLTLVNLVFGNNYVMWFEHGSGLVGSMAAPPSDFTPFPPEFLNQDYAAARVRITKELHILKQVADERAPN